MKLPYREGTCFAVPLRQGGFAVGVVARATAEGKVVLCYFFGPRRTAVPALAEVERLKPSDAIRVVRVGDLSLIRGGSSDESNRVQLGRMRILATPMIWPET